MIAAMISAGTPNSRCARSMRRLMIAHERRARLHARLVKIARAIVEPVALAERNRWLHVALHGGRVARLAKPALDTLAVETVLGRSTRR